MHDDYAPAGVAAPLEIPIAEEDIIVKSGHLTTPRINVVIKKFSAVVKKGRAGYLWEVAGIFDGDVLVVDRILEPKHNDIVLATLNNNFIVKRLYQRAGLPLN